MWRYWNGYGGGGEIVMFLLMALWWALIIAGAVFFFRWMIRQSGVRRAFPNPALTEDDPLTIAKRRYAKGEITREQFQELKETLER